MKYIYIVVNSALFDEDPDRVMYVTDNSEKAREVYNRLYEISNKAIGTEDYYPDEINDNLDNILEWDFNKFRNAFLEGVNKNEELHNKLVDDYNFDFTDESIRNEYNFLRLDLCSPEFNIYQYEFEKPYEDVSELCINAVDLWH